MGKIQLEPYLNSVRAQVLGVILGVLIILPPVLRLGEGRWTGVDWVFAVGGAAISIFWLTMAVIAWRSRRDTARPRKKAGTRPPSHRSRP